MVELTVKIDATADEALRALVGAGIRVVQARADGVVVFAPAFAEPKMASKPAAKPRKRTTKRRATKAKAKK